MTIESLIARGFQLLLAMTGAYTVALWFALIVWTFRDIESRSRSVIAQIFSTLVVVLFFIPGALIYLLLRPRETLDEAFGRALEEEYLLQDLEDLSLCPSCHHPVRDEFVACPHCFTELRRTCASCNKLVDVSWAICAYCTAELVPAPAEEEVRREERPSLLPLPLRLLRERTEVRLEHSLDMVQPERLPTGETPPGGSLIARETHAAGAWTDDSGKRSWFLSRAREVFRPLTPDEPSLFTNGNGHDAETADHSAPPPPRWSASIPRDDEPPVRVVPVTPELPTASEDDAENALSRELFSYRPSRRTRP